MLSGVLVRAATQLSRRGSFARINAVALHSAAARPALAVDGTQHRGAFERDGFVVIPEFLPKEVTAAVRERVEPLFHGKFDTEICNAWKSDRTVASVVLSRAIGRVAADIAGWAGVKIAQDDVWWKPPGAKEIGFHQDSPYFEFMDPFDVITVWIALDDVDPSSGSLEYARGSHRWAERSVRDAAITEGFHAPDHDYRSDLYKAAARAGIGRGDVDIVPVVVPAGGAAFHHRLTWHGSGVNRTAERQRRALTAHYLPSHAKFRPAGVGYTYGRYKRHGSVEMDENFFPITYDARGYRTPHLEEYCGDALSSSPSQ